MPDCSSGHEGVITCLLGLQFLRTHFQGFLNTASDCISEGKGLGILIYIPSNHFISE